MTHARSLRVLIAFKGTHFYIHLILALHRLVYSMFSNNTSDATVKESVLSAEFISDHI